MSLEIQHLISKIQEMAQAAAVQVAELERLLPAAEKALQACAREDSEAIIEKIGRAGQSWRGASPTSERPDEVLPTPDLPSRFRAIGADGSQIFPDRHGLALYYLINTGSIVVQHGSGEAPRSASRPQLFFEEQDLYPGGDSIINAEWIAGLRDAAEMTELARLADEEQGVPSLALLDNGLLLWIAGHEGGIPPAHIDSIKTEYLKGMQRIQSSGSALAGYVDRPRSANVIRLLHLAGLPVEEIDDASIRAHPFQRLNDGSLFSRILSSGQRSARFGIVSPLNQDFSLSGHGVQFFYLNTGYQDQIVRVEIPDWVGDNQTLLDLVHAGIVEECRTTGMPYVLARAHELAVVSQSDRQALDRALQTFLLEQGLAAEISQKEKAKRWLGSGRRSARRSFLL
jgi:hypothetical protein